jgi:Squalene/phytoene synthase
VVGRLSLLSPGLGGDPGQEPVDAGGCGAEVSIEHTRTIQPVKGRRARSLALRQPPAAEPQTLSAAYGRCRQLHARYGRPYYLATLLLPRWKRRHVHALYGFARYADEIVDDLDSSLDRAGQLAGVGKGDTPRLGEFAPGAHPFGEHLDCRSGVAAAASASSVGDFIASSLAAAAWLWMLPGGQDPIDGGSDLLAGDRTGRAGHQ